MWEALADVARRQRRTIHEICSEAYLNKREGETLSAVLRVYITSFYRSLAEMYEAKIPPEGEDGQRAPAADETDRKVQPSGAGPASPRGE